MVQPKIDLENPAVQQLLKGIKVQTTKVLQANRQIENAVLPVYVLQNGKTKQSGSCVALRIKEDYFLLSASHVFDSIGNYRMLIGTGEGKLLAPLAGERFSSLRGISGTHRDDPIDASVFHIQRVL